MFNLHFDSHFVTCSYEGEFRGHFGFLHLNLLVKKSYFRPTKLTQINHTIINIFSGILRPAFHGSDFCPRADSCGSMCAEYRVRIVGNPTI